MTGWIETYRGSVAPTETDLTEHLTVARYYARFAHATLALMQHNGVGIDYMRNDRLGYATVECQTRYIREFHVGDALHIESALLSVGDRKAQVGHRVFDSATGELTTVMVQNLIHMDLERRRAVPLADEKRAQLTLGTWDDAPEFEALPTPEGLDGFIDTYRDTVTPWQIDVVGHMGFQFYVERYSSAGMQLFVAMGLTPDWLRRNRRGFSTFGYHLRFFREMSAGDLVSVRTGLLHLGGSSIRILHRMVDPTSGMVTAQLDQFGVLLDLDARKPTRVPDEIRERASGLLVAAQ
jgi:acyl-CoA thioester hydrolase